MVIGRGMLLGKLYWVQFVSGRGFVSLDMARKVTFSVDSPADRAVIMNF